MKGVRADVTGARMALGTPAYMSPEQCRDAASVDHRADIYSLGCTLYALVTGRQPFDGSSAVELMTKHAYTPLVPPEEIATRVPLELSAVIQKMMAKHPGERYQSMGEVIRVLEQWLGVVHTGSRLAAGEEQIADLESCIDQFQPRADGYPPREAAHRLLLRLPARRRRAHLRRPARLGFRPRRAHPPGHARLLRPQRRGPQDVSLSPRPATCRRHERRRLARALRHHHALCHSALDAQALLALDRLRHDRGPPSPSPCASASTASWTANATPPSPAARSCSGGSACRAWMKIKSASSSPDIPVGTGKSSSKRSSATKRSSTPAIGFRAANRRGSASSMPVGASRCSLWSAASTASAAARPNAAC